MKLILMQPNIKKVKSVLCLYKKKKNYKVKLYICTLTKDNTPNKSLI